MRTRAAALAVLCLAFVSTARAADRHWQTGMWGETSIKRKWLDFGPGATSFDGRHATAPEMRAMADVRTYIIETDDLRLELEDVVPVARRSLQVTPGETVTFAIQKNAVYIRDPDDKEYRLQLTEKMARTR